MFPGKTSLREKLGLLAGALLSPMFLFGSALRGARVFHPRGICFRARVEPSVAMNAEHEELAWRLSGMALVRLSSALWRKEHCLLPNLLGFSVRFRAGHPLEAPTADSQDLLTATARSPWSVILDAFGTHQHDFLLNHYYGISPFAIDGGGTVQFRVAPRPVRAPGKDRYQRIVNAVRDSDVVLLVQIKDQERSRRWETVAEIHLEQQVSIDESRLEFRPFRDGLGVTPKGFIHSLRPAAYAASRRGRRQRHSHSHESKE